MMFLCRNLILCLSFLPLFSLSFHAPVQWKAIKAILIGFSLTAINLFSGTFAFINYTANIFQAAGFDKPEKYKDSLFDPNNSSIVVACMQIMGVYCSTLLVDRIGRKTLLIFSTSGAFVGLMSLGIYSYLHEMKYDLASCNWIPLCSFCVFIFISCFGILPLPFVVLAEILPSEVSNNNNNNKKRTVFKLGLLFVSSETEFMKNDTFLRLFSTLSPFYL